MVPATPEPRVLCVEGSGPPVPTTRCCLPVVSRGGRKTSSGPALEVQGGPGCILLVQQIVKPAQISGEGKETAPTKGRNPRATKVSRPGSHHVGKERTNLEHGGERRGGVSQGAP